VLPSWHNLTGITIKPSVALTEKHQTTATPCRRAWQSVRNPETTELDGGSASNQRLLERLEAENAQLRRSVAELALQIQVLRDDARALTA
jgi:hypothetical protein